MQHHADTYVGLHLIKNGLVDAEVQAERLRIIFQDVSEAVPHLHILESERGSYYMHMPMQMPIEDQPPFALPLTACHPE